ncbi:MAG: hypothetical protein JXA69_17640 [Phycisphaerae bacterium]|nr:hypothetical protein [Phycisphaerae bacterium]
MSTYSPSELAELVRNLSYHEAGASFCERVGPTGTRLTAEHARELLSVARGLSKWYKIMTVLMIGQDFFQNEFVDFAIDMLTLPPSEAPSAEDGARMVVLREDPEAIEDPWAVGTWACNLLVTRRTISAEQYRRIAQLPDGTFGKEGLLDVLKSRVVL